VPVNLIYYDLCKPKDFSVTAESTKVFVASLEEPLEEFLPLKVYVNL
jgi:hypothetical protein